MKRRLCKILVATILMATTLMLYIFSGCIYSKEEEWGCFTVKFYDDRETAYITGLTELGQQQRFLVIPEEIDGVKVYTIGERPLLQMWSSLGSADICSDKLEKIYIPFSISIISGSFRNSPNLIKVFSITGEFVSGLEAPARNYYTNLAYLNDLTNAAQQIISRANVSYFYNYNIEENYGYYWIDDCDYGSKIEFIPPEPERKGYTFGGWYKEPECINKWNFETDVLPEERTEINEDGEEEIVYQETKLYAKWSR